MGATRWALGAAGVAAGLWGAWLLVDGAELVDLVEVAVWFTAGVLVHDAVIAPVVIVAGVLLARWVAPWAQGPVVVAALVLGTVTLAVLPTLGRFAAKDDDPYLLNRAYPAWWLLLALLLAAGAAVAALRARRAGPPA